MPSIHYQKKVATLIDKEVLTGALMEIRKASTLMEPLPLMEMMKAPGK